MSVQYTIVGIIFLAAIIWAGIKVSKMGKGSDTCCGCALSDTCKKKEKKKDSEICEDQKDV